MKRKSVAIFVILMMVGCQGSGEHGVQQAPPGGDPVDLADRGAAEVTVTLPSSFKSMGVIVAESALARPTGVLTDFVPLGRLYDIRTSTGISDLGGEKARITFRYDAPSLKGAGLSEEFAVLAYDKANKSWAAIDTVLVDTEQHTVAAETNTLTTFAVAAYKYANNTPLTPAPACINDLYPNGLGGAGNATFSVVDEGSDYYQDRDYQILAKSESTANDDAFSTFGLKGALAISPCNGDSSCGEFSEHKRYRGQGYVSLTAHTALDVYLMYDTRGGEGVDDTSADAPWIGQRQFQSTGEKIQTTDPVNLYTVYKRSYDKGEQIYLDGNLAGVDDKGINTNYWLVIKLKGDLHDDGAARMCDSFVPMQVGAATQFDTHASEIRADVMQNGNVFVAYEDRNYFTSPFKLKYMIIDQQGASITSPTQMGEDEAAPYVLSLPSGDIFIITSYNEWVDAIGSFELGLRTRLYRHGQGFIFANKRVETNTPGQFLLVDSTSSGEVVAFHPQGNDLVMTRFDSEGVYIGRSTIVSGQTQGMAVTRLSNGNYFIQRQQVIVQPGASVTSTGSFLVVDSLGNVVVGEVVFNDKRSYYANATLLSSGDVAVAYQDYENADVLLSVISASGSLLHTGSYVTDLPLGSQWNQHMPRRTFSFPLSEGNLFTFYNSRNTIAGQLKHTIAFMVNPSDGYAAGSNQLQQETLVHVTTDEAYEIFALPLPGNRVLALYTDPGIVDRCQPFAPNYCLPGTASVGGVGPGYFVFIE